MTSDIINWATDKCIPLAGAAPVSALDGEPDGRKPQDLLMDARSFVCFALPMPQGVYRTTSRSKQTIWRAQNLYYRKLDTLSLDLALTLEKSGGRSVSVFSCFPMDVGGHSIVQGFVNLIVMGSVSGIGFPGKNGMLMHSEYGPRLMLGGVVTSLELEPFSHPYRDSGACPAECDTCVKVCPAGAITGNGTVDSRACLETAGKAPLLKKAVFSLLSLRNPDKAGVLFNTTAVDEMTMHTCSRCITMCPLVDSSIEEFA